MTLEDLRVFVAVCDRGNLSAVARELSRSQSAVSQHIKRLEREIGLALVERRPRGVVPTQAGRLLHTAARGSLNGIDSVVRQLRDLAEGTAGEVRVTTGATTVRHFMANGILAFRQRFPKVRLEFHTRVASRDCLAALLADEAEIALITIGDPVRGIEQHPFLELPWSLAVGVDDPLAGRARLDLGALEEIPHIRLPEKSASRAQLDARLAERGIGQAGSAGVADWDTVIMLAELGVGRGVVPALPGWNPSRHPRLRLIPIPDLPPLVAGWGVRQWETLTPFARTFAETIVANLV
ncbi:LysR family transcriptional regulator [Amycolatopsis sp. NPDC059027]|uniref:LysR family transcriptional regulator n=1 Tax=unclassified Amycolatopsis TaxID=2618356 RepID=UPI00366F4E76